jgi:ATP-dependent RNA helicase RhlE
MKSNASGVGAGFAALGVPQVLVHSLARMGADVPTPVQQAAVPVACTGADVAVVAATGTGKTLAYLLPVAKRLLDEPPPRVRGRPVDPRRRLRAVVLCPTRELAQQVAREAAQLFRGTVLRTTAVYGKSALAPQRDAVQEGVDLLVGTPGRVKELIELDAMSLAFANQVVLDEADRMLDMGFLPQAKEILSRAPESRQLLFFTATMPRQVESVVEEMLRDPKRVDLVGRERSKVEGTPEERRDLGQHLFDVDDEAKTALTVALVKDGKRRGVMVFCRTRRRAGWVAAALRRHEVRTVLIHGDRSQRQRNEALEAFTAGKADVVVATDVAARGLHVPAARCVINYDVPLMPEEYVHRVGRAGHGGGSAEAFTFRCPTDEERWMHVERAMRVKLVAERPPAHGAYMRTRDGFAPDTESDPRTMRGATRKAHGQRASRSGNGARTAASGARSMGQRPAPAAASRARAGGEAPTTPSGRSLADLIRNAPKAVRKKRKRLQQGGGKAKAASNLRGKQRKAPIAKGQRPGGGVRRAT